jgi:cysteine-rich repeat protein
MRCCAHVVACVATAGVLSGCLRDTSHLCENAEACADVDATGPDDAAAGEDGAPGADAAPGIDATVDNPWGDGHHGDLTVSIAQAQINDYGFVRQEALAGATQIAVSHRDGATVGAWPDNYEAGDRVMVWRTAGLAAPLTSGSTTPLVLDGDVGRWYVTRVVERTADRLTLADPLPFVCPADATQVIKLPELDTITINAASEVFAVDWQGQYGGLVGFYANQLVIDGGVVSAGSDGFNGGQPEDFGDFNNCTALDGRSPSGGGAAKGEGPVTSRYGIGISLASGRGNMHNGGGGGDCRNGGGGGGALGGAGGVGGNDIDARPFGGMPGVPVHFAPLTHLTMGGGGGAGENNTTMSGEGGYGGGVVWLTVREISCVNGGAISASGNDGFGEANEGGGGGGGGGVIWIRAETITGCALRAVGGDGGSTANTHGPGGGGGGGRIVVMTDAMVGVTSNVSGGAPGDPGLGAAAGQAGLVCGNGALEPGETCDDGNSRPGDACTSCSE